jgi:molecular chaperone DnaJ
MDLNDIFAQFGDIFGGHFGGGGFGFGGGRRQQPRKFKGSDLRMKVSLSLEEINTGVTKKFKVKKDVTCTSCQGSGCAEGAHPETCATCQGSGYVVRTKQTMLGMMQTQDVCPSCHGEGTIIKNQCKHCHGEGVVAGEEIVEIEIPAGVQDGMVVTARGKGNAGRHSGVAGDIQVFIENKRIPNFSEMRTTSSITFSSPFRKPHSAPRHKSPPSTERRISISNLVHNPAPCFAFVVRDFPPFRGMVMARATLS